VKNYQIKILKKVWYLECIFTKKLFHRLESDSARNNIHSNNKQKAEITNKNTGKKHVNMASQAECTTQ